MEKLEMRNWLIDEYEMQYTESKKAVEAKSHFEGRLSQLEKVLLNLFGVTILTGTKNIYINNRHGDVLLKMKK